jgi:hypothetical protein
MKKAADEMSPAIFDQLVCSEISVIELEIKWLDEDAAAEVDEVIESEKEVDSLRYQTT